MTRPWLVAGPLLLMLLHAPSVRAQCTGCTGDLNGDALVRINELVTAVNAALSGCPVASAPTTCGGDCPGDRDANDVVTVDELVAAVRSAVSGCPATPTPSLSPVATDSATPVVPTPSPTLTQTATDTTTPSALASPTSTSDSGQSPTPTLTAMATATITNTDTPIPSASSTSTMSATASIATATPAVATATPSATNSVAATAAAATATATLSPTRSATAVATSVPSASPSATRTASLPPATAPPTASAPPTQTATSTGIASATAAATETASRIATGTHTATRTPSGTATRTVTATSSSTASATAAASFTATRTPTASPTLTPIATFTLTLTRTPTASAPPTATGTATRTQSATPSRTNTRTTTPSATSSATAGACASSNFLNVTGAAGAGAGYPTPSLSVSCNSTTVTVQSNGIPTYEYVPLTPNGLQAKSYTFMFPRNPSVAANPTGVPLLGNMAVAVNGIPIYSANEGPQPTSDAYGNPIAAAILDECGSHSAQQGTFHYHQLLVKCLLQSAVAASQPWDNADPSPSTPSPVIAYAFDGFPIYGPYECSDAGCSDVQEMRSGWDTTGYQAGTLGCSSSAQCSNGYCTEVLINGSPTTACVPKTCTWSHHAFSAKAGAEYLDQCNGHYGPNGDYHYHATSTFPYILGCYRGAPTSNGGSGTPPGGTCPASGAATPTTGPGAPTATRTPTLPGPPPPSATRTPTIPAGPSPTRTNTRTATSTPTATGSPVPTLTASSTTCGGMWDELTTLYANATNVGSCTGIAGAQSIINSLMDVSGILVKPLGASQSIESCLEFRCDSTYLYVATNNLGHYQYSTNNPRPSAETRYLYRIPMQRTAIGTPGQSQNAATLSGCTAAYDQYLAFPDTSTMGEPSGYCAANAMQLNTYLYDDVGGGARTYYKKVRCLTTNGFVNSGVNIISSTESSNGSFGSPAYYYPSTGGQSYEGTADGVPSLDLCGGHGHHHAANERCFALDSDRTPLYSYSQATSTFNFQSWLDSACTDVSGIVGYMFDGTPIKGPCVCMARDGGGNCTSIKRARSAYVYAGLNVWGDDPDEEAALGMEGMSCSSDNDCDDDHFQCAWGVFDDDSAAGGTVVARRCVMVNYAWCANAYVNRSSEDVSATNFVYLDRCNGITGADGYAYHATGSFPYVPACLRYEPSDSISDASLD